MSFTFSFLPDFVAKTQNHTVYDPWFGGFDVPSLVDFMTEDRDKMLLCPISALKRYLSKTEQLRPACSTFFIWMINP